MIHIHTQFILQILENIPPHSFEIIARQNPAIIQYPTDFIVINVFNTQSNTHNEILSLLNQSNDIKYINTDTIIRRQLFNSEEDQEDTQEYPRTGGKLHTPFPEFEDE